MGLSLDLENWRWNGGVENDALEKIETNLEVRIPDYYREFILKYGSGTINGFDLFGAYPDLDVNDGALLNILSINLRFRKAYNLKSYLLIIGDASVGDNFCINLNTASSPIYIWNPSLSERDVDELEVIANDFNDLVNKIVNEKI